MTPRRRRLMRRLVALMVGICVIPVVVQMAWAHNPPSGWEGTFESRIQDETIECIEIAPPEFQHDFMTIRNECDGDIVLKMSSCTLLDCALDACDSLDCSDNEFTIEPGVSDVYGITEAGVGRHELEHQRRYEFTILFDRDDGTEAGMVQHVATWDDPPHEPHGDSGCSSCGEACAGLLVPPTPAF